MLPLRAVQPSSRTPVVTFTLIAVCILVFVAWQPRDPPAQQEFFLERAAIPCELTQGAPLTLGEAFTGDCERGVGGPGGTELFPEKNVWTAVGTSLFLHGDLWHLLGNMLFLWVFGRNVEDRVGPFWFLVTYLLFGSAAQLAHVAFNVDSTIPVIGASGAIAGIMGMYLVLWPRARILTLVGWIVIPVPAWLVLGAWIVLQFLTDPNSGVAYVAHIGGFFAGIAVGLVVRSVTPPPFDPARARAPEPYDFD